jgi:hypothetical protein
VDFWSIEPLHNDIEDLIFNVVKVNRLCLGLDEVASESSPEELGAVNGKLLVDFVRLSMLSSANVDIDDLKEFFRAASKLMSDRPRNLESLHERGLRVH